MPIWKCTIIKRLAAGPGAYFKKVSEQNLFTSTSSQNATLSDFWNTKIGMSMHLNKCYWNFYSWTYVKKNNQKSCIFLFFSENENRYVMTASAMLFQFHAKPKIDKFVYCYVNTSINRFNQILKYRRSVNICFSANADAIVHVHMYVFTCWYSNAVTVLL